MACAPNCTRPAIGTARCSTASVSAGSPIIIVIVIVDGGAKPNSTRLPDSFYEDLAALGATAELDPPPFATADDFARIALGLLLDQ
jgi:hypothetical protein